MVSQRLYLREQTLKQLNDVLKMTKAKQMVFFGVQSETELNDELFKVNVKLKDGIVVNWVKWDILLLDTDTVIGSCGFHNWYPEHERAEIGYVLREQYRGHGFMTEALKAVINYGFMQMQLNRIEALISPNNTPSHRVVKTLNFTKEGVLRQHYKFKNKLSDSVVYSLLKSDYNLQ